MTNIQVKKINEVHFKVVSDSRSVHYELNNYFQFELPNAQYMKKRFKYKKWDGKIRLYSLSKNLLYCGLYSALLKWSKSQNYTIENVDDAWYGSLNDVTNITKSKITSELYNYTPSNLQIRDYQLYGIYYGIKHHRVLFLSPTGSGKSFIIYGLVCHYVNLNKKILIIVPTISLVEQMRKDFISYGMDDNKIHCISAGKPKTTNKKVTVSTWQSLLSVDPAFFIDYSVAIGDEAHLFKAKSLTTIMENTVNAKYRFGFTGTLDGSKTHKIILEGLFGETKQLTTTVDLVKKKQLSNFKVKIVILDHQKNDIVFNEYRDEAKYIVNLQKRNEFLVKLVQKLKGNTILFFNFVESHGTVLYDMISNSKESYFIHGKIKAEERETVREIAETKNDIVLVASYGVFSTGINIKNIHNIVFGFPSRSKIRIFQSIGRSLRLHSSKEISTIYDIADNINGNNFTLNQLSSRIKYYETEKYNYKLHSVLL